MAKEPSFRQPYIQISGGYIITAAIWILFSDAVLHSMGIDEAHVPGLSIFKGICFVVVTGTILYVLLRREFEQRSHLEAGLREQMARFEQSQETLAHSEDRFRKAVEEAPQPIAIYAEDGQILTISRTWLAFTGYTREQLASIGAWLELAYGERQQPIRERIDRLFELHDRLDEGEFVIRCADGSRQVWLFSSTPLGRLPDGRRIVMSLATDVTRRKEAERQLRIKDSAIASSITPIALADLNGLLTYVNPAFLRMWKLEDETQAIGHPVLEFWKPPEAAQAMLDALAEADNYIGELVAQFADDTTAEIAVSASLVRDEDGQPVCMMGSFQDVTGQKQAEAYALENTRLQARFQKEQERNAFVQRIISALSHDLRTPLTVIATSKDILMNYHDRIDEAKRMEKLDVIGRQVQFVLELLQDTVNIARGNLSDAPFRPAPVNLPVLCQVSVRELQTSASSSHTLRFVNKDGTQPVLADEVLISRILLNLLSNAVKYSPPGTEIRLELDQHEEWILLRVIDEGMGIRPEDLPHIFDPFYRSDDVNEINGTGLGLSIVRDCVERHQGQISVESEIGRGTTFTVRLPYMDGTTPMVAAG